MLRYLPVPKAVNGVRSRASARKTDAGIWRRIYTCGTDYWSRFLDSVSGALSTKQVARTHRLVVSASMYPTVNLVVVGGSWLAAEPRRRALDPGTSRPRSDGHHRPGGDEFAEALLMRERVAGAQWPHAGSGDAAHGRRSPQHPRTAPKWLPPHLLFHPHLH